MDIELFKGKDFKTYSAGDLLLLPTENDKECFYLIVEDNSDIFSIYHLINLETNIIEKEYMSLESNELIDIINNKAIRIIYKNDIKLSLKE